MTVRHRKKHSDYTAQPSLLLVLLPLVATELLGYQPSLSKRFTTTALAIPSQSNSPICHLSAAPNNNPLQVDLFLEEAAERQGCV